LVATVVVWTVESRRAHRWRATDRDEGIPGRTGFSLSYYHCERLLLSLATRVVKGLLHGWEDAAEFISPQLLPLNGIIAQKGFMQGHLA